MDKELKKLTIDAERFAYTVVSSHYVENGMPEDIAKKQLALYDSTGRTHLISMR